MRILVADDHDLVRETLAAFLEKEERVSVTHAASLDEALIAIRKTGPFDLALLDFMMPGMNGLEGLRRALEMSGGNPVALISGTANRSVADDALRAGAAGFLPKTMAARSMMNAVRFMAMGEIYAPLEFMTGKEETAAAAGDLTEREAQVLRGICEGKANKEIARDTDLQEVTIKLHVKNLCRKLGARNRTHAAMIAKDRHLV